MEQPVPGGPGFTNVGYTANWIHGQVASEYYSPKQTAAGPRIPVVFTVVFLSPPPYLLGRINRETSRPFGVHFTPALGPVLGPFYQGLYGC